MQIERKIASLVARQQTLQGRAETLRRIVETNRRCPRADWQVHDDSSVQPDRTHIDPDRMPCIKTLALQHWRHL